MSLARAIESGDVSLLPSRRDEDWRWTDLRGLVRSLPQPSPANEGALPAGPFVGHEEILIINGRGPASVTLEAGDNRQIALRFVATAGAGAHVARVAIALGKDARLVLLESYEGYGEAYLSDAALTFTLGESAAVERIVIAEDSAEAVSVTTAHVVMAAGSSFAQTLLTTGARRQRLETHVAHPGAGASVRLDGVYLLAEKRHADITTLVTHEGVDGTTHQLVKGMARDQSRGVFQGRIVVAKGADKTDARMGHHALILGDKAEVDAKPELEIWADDVACAHGNTVGALDEEALFYAAQRGIPDVQARAMLTEAFVGEVIDRIEDKGAQDVARAWVATRLGAA